MTDALVEPFCPSAFAAVLEKRDRPLPYTLAEVHRGGEIDPGVNRILGMFRAFAQLRDEEGSKPQVILDFTPEDSNGNELPLATRTHQAMPCKRLILNTPFEDEVGDTDQFEFGRWLSEFIDAAYQHDLSGRLELVVFFGSDFELSMELALVRIEWRLYEEGFRLVQPYYIEY